jgi:hypothetical protein
MDVAFMRAQVHLRSGLQSGPEPTFGKEITALYDAVLLGMRDYIARHAECASFVENADPWDAPALYHALVRAGVFDDPRYFNRFSLMVERVLWQGSAAFDDAQALEEAEKMLMKLGFIPFDRAALRDDSPLVP